MSSYDLSILIPARHEEFISNTVDNILKQKRGKTEILVGLDGAWADPAIVDHPDVRIIYSSEPLGQRGMGNKLATLSTAKYIAKTDGHCAFDEGFDVKLMEAMKGHDDWTIAPAMKNLHVFNWVCEHCETEYYQGEKPEVCRDEMCHDLTQSFTKKIYFEPRNKLNSGKNGPTSVGYRFTPDKLQFKYFNALKGYFQDEITESMSLQGSFFMCTREKYWSLNINDESWGGWGQQGSETALKTWLSGGKVMIHRGTWYAHMFRTNNQVAFPWNRGLKESQGQQQQRARQACADLFKNNAWEHQVYPLSWLVERFWEPLQQEVYETEKGDRPWTQADLAELKKTEGRFSPKSDLAPGVSKGILYFTDGELPEKLAKPVLERLQKISQDKNMPLEISLREAGEERGYLTMFKQILRGLERLQTDIVFMAEHDVLYPPEHFDFTPPDKRFWYDQNWYKVHSDGHVVSWDADQVSGLCAYRDELIKYYRYRIDTFDKENFDRKFEPFSGEGSASWKAPVAHIDIRHNHNLTYNKRELRHFRKKETAVNFQTLTIDEIPGWNPDEIKSVFDV